MDASIFLTVGNIKQKTLCENLIAILGIKKNYNITVVSDDDFGHRLGSGGAMLKIISEHYEKGKKFLIINSGGMSKRSINYAIKGKAFSNIIYQNQITTLLEAILTNAEKIVNAIPSGLVSCCSDILLDTKNIDITHLTENTIFGIRTNLKTASQHGVIVCNSNKMVQYLHKQSQHQLKTILQEDSAIVDIGVNYFTDSLTSELQTLWRNSHIADSILRNKFELNLFSDIICLLSQKISKDDYLKTETQNFEHQKAKEILFNNLSHFSANVFEIPKQDFMHFGSTCSAISNIFKLSDKTTSFLKINSYLDINSRIGSNVLLDTTQLENCEIGNNCFLSDISLKNITIPDETAVCGIHLTDGSFVTIICDIKEDPKTYVGKKTLWETNRFYKGFSFTDSLEKFLSNKDEETYSMEYCIENADFGYPFNMIQYLLDMNDFMPNKEYFEKRKEIISHYFSTKRPLEAVVCNKSKVEVSLPLRINFSGTWTDAMPYCIDNGGQVINAAVEIDGQKPVKVILEKLKNDNIEFCSDGVSTLFNFQSFENDLSEFNLHKAVLETIGFNPNTHIECGFKLTTCVNNIDKGSGLGTSSILIGGCLMALNEMFNLKYEKSDLINMVFIAEQIMGTGGGWQDQVGGLTPGLKISTTSPGNKQLPTIEPIPISPFFEKIFSERTVLLPTGQRHFGRFIVNDVVNRYLQKDEKSIAGHEEIRKLNSSFKTAFLTDDYDAFITCINKHHNISKKLSEKITNPSIDKIIAICLEKADAVSVLGAGGGGYLFVVLKTNVSFNEFKKFIQTQFPHIKSDIKKINLCQKI